MLSLYILKWVLSSFLFSFEILRVKETKFISFSYFIASTNVKRESSISLHPYMHLGRIKTGSYLCTATNWWIALELEEKVNGETPIHLSKAPFHICFFSSSSYISYSKQKNITWNASDNSEWNPRINMDNFVTPENKLSITAS